MSSYIIFAIGSSLLAILYGLGTAKSILSKSAGSARMQEISSAIAVGAKAYLNKQYKVIAPIALVIFLLLWYFIDLTTGMGFWVGAIASALAGYIGMNVSVRANVRSAEAAKGGLAPALSVAFRG
ncbi:MAG: sodium/proton-translocating pyrophosphatase, partial [Patescibacteria group bacterium]